MATYFISDSVGLRLFTTTFTEAYRKDSACAPLGPGQWYLRASYASLLDANSDDVNRWGAQHMYSFQTNWTDMVEPTGSWIGAPDTMYLELTSAIYISPPSGLTGSMQTIIIQHENDDGTSLPSGL